MESRIIRVTGKGSIKVRPDMTRLTLSLEGTFPEYSEALRKSSEDTETLKDVLATLGFERADLKTLMFNVDTAYEGYRDKDNSYKQRFIGYKYSHTTKVEFDSDNERLGKTLYALAHANVRPEFHISYTVKDHEAAKKELLGKAIRDAKAKADVLTAAAGVKLREIISIDYSWGEINFEVHPMNRMLAADDCLPTAAPSAKYDMDIEPDDIEVSDTVTVVWTIE